MAFAWVSHGYMEVLYSSPIYGQINTNRMRYTRKTYELAEKQLEGSIRDWGSSPLNVFNLKF